MTWRIRWYLIIAITIAYGLSLIGGLIGFAMTKDVHFLAFIAPTALIPFVRYLVPMDKKKYDLQQTALQNKKDLIEAKLQIRLLEAEIKELQGKKGSPSVTKQQKQLP